MYCKIFDIALFYLLSIFYLILYPFKLSLNPSNKSSYEVISFFRFNSPAYYEATEDFVKDKKVEKLRHKYNTGNQYI